MTAIIENLQSHVHGALALVRGGTGDRGGFRVKSLTYIFHARLSEAREGSDQGWDCNANWMTVIPLSREGGGACGEK